jgi:membrane protease YdiL (CAAX protease family)
MPDPPAPPSPALVQSPRKEVWPSLLALFLGPVAAAILSSVVLAVCIAATSPEARTGNFQENVEAWILEHVGTLFGAFVLLLPGQAAMLAVALTPAVLSREGPLRRLGLVRWSVSLPTVGLVVLGTLGIQWVITFVAEVLIEEPSESLKTLWRMFSEPTGATAVLAGLLISVLPGLCEESLFRGYVQTRLLQRWPPILAIGLTSVVFAVAHFDVQHSLAVFPLGVWFGFVAWRTGSVWTSVVCHFANNLTAFVAGRLWGDPESGGLPHEAVFFAVGAALSLCTFLAARALLREKPRAC